MRPRRADARSPRRLRSRPPSRCDLGPTNLAAPPWLIFPNRSLRFVHTQNCSPSSPLARLAVAPAAVRVGAADAVKLRRLARSSLAPPCRAIASSFVAKIAIRFRASRNRRSRVGDQVIKLLELYEIEDSEHLFGEGCLWCNLCLGKEEGVEADLQEFQDFDEFED
uniref:Uncharacterized protein n=1 Tax=Zea mays TaxID=4577 RepID=B6SN35_MAIZE|nr:hypothetical protein [Zea mays]